VISLVGTGPRLHLLFMTRQSLPHQQLWKQWMQDAPSGAVTALVLCKKDCAVDSSIFKQIPTVKTEYCSDLVTGMNALLVAGVKARGGHHNDKFVFVSDTTIPVKPFGDIFGQLTSTATSDICIPPRHTWNSYQQPMKRKVFLNVKHHQWIVLSRKHAELAIKRFAKVGPHPPGLHLKHGQRSPTLRKWTLDKGHPRSRLRGCVDEFWYMQQLYGTFIYNAGFTEVVPIQGLTNAERLYLNSEHDQGKCDTFVHAAGWDHGLNSNFTSLRKLLAETKNFKVVEKGNGAYHPDDIEQMSADSLEVLRASPFLFARKIPGNLKFSSDTGESLAMAFQRVILRQSVGVADPFAEVAPRSTTATTTLAAVTTTLKDVESTPPSTSIALRRASTVGPAPAGRDRNTDTGDSEQATRETTTSGDVGADMNDYEGIVTPSDEGSDEGTIAPSEEDADLQATMAPSEDSDFEGTMAPNDNDADSQGTIAPSDKGADPEGAPTTSPEDDWFDDDVVVDDGGVGDDDSDATSGAVDDSDEWDDDDWDDDDDDDEDLHDLWDE